MRRATRIARPEAYIAEDDDGHIIEEAIEGSIEDEQSMLEAIMALEDDWASDGTADAARAPARSKRATIEICFFIF